MTTRSKLLSRIFILFVTVLLASCSTDFRKDVTTGEARPSATEQNSTWPAPDEQGLVQVDNRLYYSTQENDTLFIIANRIDEDPVVLSRLNNIQPGVLLPAGQIISLPQREIMVEEEVVLTEMQPNNQESRSEFKSNFFRHEVNKGQTIYDISNLYDVSVRTVADWNKLGSDFAIEENDILLIPVPELIADAEEPNQPETVVFTPDVQKETISQQEIDTPNQPEEVPPSAPPVEATTVEETPINTDNSNATSVVTIAESTPLQEPAEDKPTELNCSNFQPLELNFRSPLEGTLLKAYGIGGNKGIDIGAEGGTPVYAVASGEVQLVKEIANDTTVLLLLHQCNVHSVYQNIADVDLTRGEKVTHGQIIGNVDSNFDYLHYEVRIGAEPQNPEDFLPFIPN